MNFILILKFRDILSSIEEIKFYDILPTFKHVHETLFSIKMLKSEVEQLDEAFGKIFNDEPQQSVIDNLKKKHGLLVNDNKDYDALGMVI